MKIFCWADADSFWQQGMKYVENCARASPTKSRDSM